MTLGKPKIIDLQDQIDIIDTSLVESMNRINSNGIYTKDYATLQDAFNNLTSGKTLIFEQGKTYTLNATITIKNRYVKNISILGNNATLNFTHTGDGLNLSTANGEYDQNFIIKDLNIVGCDPYFPTSEDEYISIGAGLKMDYCYACSIQNVQVSGFKYGLSSLCGIKNVFSGNTSFMRNQYGIYCYGNVFNNNDFIDCRIRENRKYGIYLAMDDSGASQGAPVANIFTNCLIESNRAYINGSSDTTGTAVYLYRSLDNVFTDCYFENNPITIHFKGNSCGNRINSCRFEYAFHSSYVAKFEPNGYTLTNIIFNACTHNNLSQTQQTESFTVTAKLDYGIQLINCIGFKVTRSNLLYSNIDMINCALTQGWGGTRNQTLSIPYHGRTVDTYEDNANNVYAGIVGIGTANATLKLRGQTEITFASSITASTTITTFDGLINGQLLILNCSSLTYPVTIKAQTRTSTSTIFMNSDCVLSKYGDQIVFWVNYVGKAIEISRSIAP